MDMDMDIEDSVIESVLRLHLQMFHNMDNNKKIHFRNFLGFRARRQPRLLFWRRQAQVDVEMEVEDLLLLELGISPLD